MAWQWRFESQRDALLARIAGNFPPFSNIYFLSYHLLLVPLQEEKSLARTLRTRTPKTPASGTSMPHDIGPEVTCNNTDKAYRMPKNTLAQS